MTYKTCKPSPLPHELSPAGEYRRSDHAAGNLTLLIESRRGIVRARVDEYHGGGVHTLSVDLGKPHFVAEWLAGKFPALAFAVAPYLPAEQPALPIAEAAGEVAS